MTTHQAAASNGQVQRHRRNPASRIRIVTVLAAALAALAATLGSPPQPASAMDSTRYVLDMHGDLVTASTPHLDTTRCGLSYLQVLGRFDLSDPDQQEAHIDPWWDRCVNTRAMQHFDAYMRSDGTVHLTGRLGAHFYQDPPHDTIYKNIDVIMRPGQERIVKDCGDAHEYNGAHYTRTYLLLTNLA